MKITFDTEKKTISIIEAVAVEELIKFFEENGIDTDAWKIDVPQAQMIPLPYYPGYPHPASPGIMPWEITYTGSGKKPMQNEPNTCEQ